MPSSATNPFLVDLPRPGAAAAWVIADWDGVFNVLRQDVDRTQLPHVRGSGSRPISICMIDDEILDVLDEAIQPAGIHLGWLST